MAFAQKTSTKHQLTAYKYNNQFLASSQAMLFTYIRNSVSRDILCRRNSPYFNIPPWASLRCIGVIAHISTLKYAQIRRQMRVFHSIVHSTQGYRNWLRICAYFKLMGLNNTAVLYCTSFQLPPDWHQLYFRHGFKIRTNTQPTSAYCTL